MGDNTPIIIHKYIMKLTKRQITHLMTASLFILLASLTSCEYRTEINNRNAMEQAELLLDESPDSTLQLLNTVQTGLLDQLHYARYQVIRARAKDKLNMEITSDTTVFLARDYLVYKKDDYAALSCFVTGNIYGYRGKNSLALMDYMKAVEQVKDDDYKLKIRIYFNLARICFSQRLYMESLEYAKRAQLYENQTEINKMHKVYILELIGLNYVFLNETNNAMLYFEKGLNLLDKSDLYVGHIFSNIALALRDMGQYPEAKRKCFQAMSLFDQADSLKTGRLHLILGTVYHKTGVNDSAYINAYQAKIRLDKVGNIKDLTDMYALLSIVESEKGNIIQAAVFKTTSEMYVSMKKYGDDLQHMVQAKEDTNLIKQAELDRTLIQSLMWRNISIILTSILIITFGILFFRWYRRRQEARMKEELNGQQLQFDELETQYRDELESIKTMLNDERINRLYRIDDLAELRKYMLERNDKQVRYQIKKILSYNTWDDIYPIIDSLYPDLLERIKNDYPGFTLMEFKTCCLLLMGFGGITIAAILNDTNVGTVYNRSTAIREKMELEQRMDIKESILNKYNVSARSTNKIQR